MRAKNPLVVSALVITTLAVSPQRRAAAVAALEEHVLFFSVTLCQNSSIVSEHELYYRSTFSNLNSLSDTKHLPHDCIDHSIEKWWNSTHTFYTSDRIENELESPSRSFSFRRDL